MKETANETAKGGMLVAAPARWDEACFSLPAVRAARAVGLSVGVLCAAEQEELWKALPGVRVLPFPGKKSVKETAETLRGNWEAALLWEPGPAAEACRRAGISRRIGPAGKPLGKCLTHPVETDPPGPVRHRVTFYLSLVSQLGMPVDLPELFLPIMEPRPEPNTVVLSPDSDFGRNHEWPLAGWQEIGRRFLQHGWHITVASVSGSKGLAKTFSTSLGNDARFFEAIPLAGALPLLGSHALVVAADGFLPHAAAMAGSTCVTLFGPNDPVWKRPLGKQHAVVKQHVECAPCLEEICRLDSRCQKELPVEKVWDAVVSRIPALK